MSYDEDFRKYTERGRTAVIFGVTGQDGSYLAELLLDKGYKVVGVARRTSLPSTGRLFVCQQSPHFELVRGDVTDALGVHRILSKHQPSEVYNLAAQSHVGDSFEEPAHTTAVVYGGCLNILEAVRNLRPSTGIKVYQASSSEMYGSHYSYVASGRYGPRLVHSNETPIFAGVDPFQDERTPFSPNSPYAIAKLAAHHLCRVYRESYGIFVCSGILFNHESPRRPRDFVTRKVTAWAADQARRYGHYQPLYKLELGNLDAYRDWGFAGDYVRAMWLMLQQDAPDDYVIATGKAHSVHDLVRAAVAALPGEVQRALGNDYIHCRADLLRPCEVPYLRGEAGKARAKLGWEPTVSFEGLVKMMVEADLDGTSVG